MAVSRSRAEEFRRKAQEYFDLAGTISLETDRAIVIDIAQNYLRLAEEQEAQEAVIQPPPTAEQPQPMAQQQQQVQPKDDDKKE
jgi:uncharacterized protein HemY